MKTKNKIFTYQIINSHIKNPFLNQTKISYNFISTVYKFLRYIYENILLLQTHDIFVFDMSHMWINKMINIDSSNILYERIFFDLKQYELYGKIDNNDNYTNNPSKIMIPKIFGISILISNIKDAISRNNNHCNNLKYINENKKKPHDDIKNIYIEKQKIHNEIHKKSNSIDPMIIIQNNKDKNKKNILKEKNEEKKRIFLCDLSVYNNIKKDLENKIIDEIPPLFMNKFLIFKLLDEDNLLNSDDNYTLFMAMYESDNDSVDENNNNNCINNYIDKNEFDNNIDIHNLFNNNNIK